MVRPADDFTLMVDRTLADVSRYALRRSSSSADAEDAVAETYAVAWRRRHEIPGEPETLPWLYGVARRTLANGRRSGNRWDRLRAKVGGQRPTSSAPEPDGIVTRQPVLDALGQLAPKDAELLRLLTWEQLSQAEAAVALGLSENAVALRASRARRKLATILGENPEHDDRSIPMTDMQGRTAGKEER